MHYLHVINTQPTKLPTLYQRLTTVGTWNCDASSHCQLFQGSTHKAQIDLIHYNHQSILLCNPINSLTSCINALLVAKRGYGHSVKNATWDVQAAQCAFKNLMIHEVLRFALHIAFRRVLHRCGSQDIRCWKPYIIITSIEKTEDSVCSKKTNPPPISPWFQGSSTSTRAKEQPTTNGCYTLPPPQWAAHSHAQAQTCTHTPACTTHNGISFHSFANWSCLDSVCQALSFSQHLTGFGSHGSVW